MDSEKKESRKPKQYRLTAQTHHHLSMLASMRKTTMEDILEQLINKEWQEASKKGEIYKV